MDSSSYLDRSMFGYSNFNQDISGWNVENFENQLEKQFWTNPAYDIMKGIWHLDSAKVPKWGYSITRGASASAISMGATNISVSNASDFQVGDRLVVGRGTPNEEITAIVGNGAGDIVANDTNDEQQIRSCFI